MAKGRRKLRRLDLRDGTVFGRRIPRQPLAAFDAGTPPSHRLSVPLSGIHLRFSRSFYCYGMNWQIMPDHTYKWQVYCLPIRLNAVARPSKTRYICDTESTATNWNASHIMSGGPADSWGTTAAPSTNQHNEYAVPRQPRRTFGPLDLLQQIRMVLADLSLPALGALQFKYLENSIR